MSGYPVDNDGWMLETFGYTKAELRDMMLAGEDIGSVFDGDPMELLS
jgi:hypothetical protein